MKKFVSLLLALCLVLGMTAAIAEGVPADQIKIGYICIGDENEGYSANHINSLKRALERLGVSESQVVYKFNVSESEAAYEAAVECAEEGCDIVFATSFGHESHVFSAAEEYPEIQFCHATGVAASASELTNVHNYFPAIYEARYVSGIVAGMKLNEMIDSGAITADAAKIGYVGAFPFSEVISGYTAFYLGARSVCPSATMEVKYTGSWGDLNLEKATAEALIANGCVLISQHADTTGAPTAAETAGVPVVGYNISMIAAAPTQALSSAACDWSVYLEYAIKSVIDGAEMPRDWCGGYAENAVYITELNEGAVAAGTAEAVAAAEEGLKAGTLNVFDVSTFTCQPAADGSYAVDADGHLTSAFGLDGDGDFVNDNTEVVIDGAYRESTVRSAPYFGIIIDGITVAE